MVGDGQPARLELLGGRLLGVRTTDTAVSRAGYEGGSEGKKRKGAAQTASVSSAITLCRKGMVI